MKGIIISISTETNLFPITIPTIKQLLPIYDKPMIYYPLSVLMLAGIRDILIIVSNEKERKIFQSLLGTGENIGLNFTYDIQEESKGIAEVFIENEKFIRNDNVVLILGDNIFFGNDLQNILKKVAHSNNGSTIFGYNVSSPERYSVIEFDENKKVISIEEHPKEPKSKYAITGLYYYDNKVSEIVKTLKESKKEKIELIDLNNEYLKLGQLKVELMGRGFAWLDTDTYNSLLEASSFVSIIEKRQGLKIACIEEVAYNLGYINDTQLEKLAEPFLKNSYGQYILKILNK